MHNLFRPVTISLLPNLVFEDIRLLVKLIFKFTDYQNKKISRDFSVSLSNYLNSSRTVLFDSGRAALYFLLKNLKIGVDDEVIIQAFTCVAVPNAIIWTGALPVYVDINKNWNIDFDLIKAKINKKTRAIIVQYTFGIPVQIQEIKNFCDKNKIYLIEDCAHCLGAKKNGKMLGSFGKAAICSFGMDKAISSLCGGAVVTDDKKLAERLENEIQHLSPRNNLWIFGQFIYTITIFIILQIYSFFGLGKLLHFILKQMGIINRQISKGEKMKQTKLTANNEARMFYRFPDIFGLLAKFQLNKLDGFIIYRQRLAKMYSDTLHLSFDPCASYLRYPVMVYHRDRLLFQASKKDIFLGNWYDQVIAPKDLDVKNTGYIAYSCPLAEKMAEMTINLPTNPSTTINDAQKIVSILKQWKLEK